MITIHHNTLFSKNFILIATGQIISIFGNQILRYALPLYLLGETGSSVLFGSIMAISFIPMVLLFPIGGIIADRVHKRNIMVILDFTAALIIFIFFLLAGKVNIIPLMAITMIVLYGIQGAYQPAVKASIPAIVETNQMMKANSVVDMINSAASMGGPVIGGLIFSVFGLTPILQVSIACFLASAMMELFIRIPFEKMESSGNIFITGFSDLKSSFRFMLRTQPALWKVSLVFAASNLMLTPLILIGLPVVITQHLGLEANIASRLYGYAQGVVAAGAILGGFLAVLLSRRLKSKKSPILLAGCSLSMILGGAALHLLDSPMAIYVILLIMCGLLLTLHTIFQIQVVTALQIITPKELIGKVISCFMCIVMCTSPLGQFIYGFAFEQIGNRIYVPFYTAGAIMVGASIITRGIFNGLETLTGGQEREPESHMEPRLKSAKASTL